MSGLLPQLLSTIHVSPQVGPSQRPPPALSGDAVSQRPPLPASGVDRVELSAAGQEALAREAAAATAIAGPTAAGEVTGVAAAVTAESATAPSTAPEQGPSSSPGQGVAAEQRDEVAPRERGADGQPLSDEQLRELSELRRRDAEVRAHEEAHLAAAGGLALGGASYSYAEGPDGRQYAVGGEVRIDTSPIPGDPEATIRKMEQVRRAALAPAQPSPADRAIAAQASLQANEARQELLQSLRDGEGDALAGQAGLRINMIADQMAAAFS